MNLSPPTSEPQPEPPASPPTAQAATWATVSLMALPWLSPFTSGPNASVLPLLVSWACVAALLLWWSALAITPQQRLRSVALAWAIAASTNAVLGLLQYLDASAAWSPWVNQPGLGQAFGNLRQRNQFASLCTMGVCTLAWWAQQRGPQASRAPAWDLLGLGALLGAASAASGSRTGLLQLVLLLVLVLVWRRASGALRPAAPRWPLSLLGVALAAYVLAALALPGLAGVDGSVFGRLQETSAQCTSRLNLWRNVLYLVAQKPLLGWGWEGLKYAHFITQYDAPWAGLRFCEIVDNAHNLPLHLAVELGLPLALLAVLALGAWLWRHQPWRETAPARQLAWAVLGAIGVHSLLEYPLWYGPFQLAVLLCLWVLHAFPTDAGVPAAVAGDALADQRSNGGRDTRWGWPAAWAAGVIALAVAAAAHSYWRVSQPYLAPDERAPAYRTLAWDSLRSTWLFAQQVDFAELALTPVTEASAPRLWALGLQVLHFSPEPVVLQKLLQSGQMLGYDADVAFYTRRFATAYPDDYARWVEGPCQSTGCR